MLPAVILLQLAFWALGAPQLGFEDLMNVIVQNSTVALIAVGLTLVILAGGLDLSVGATVATTAVISAAIMKATESATLGFTFGITAGLIIGALIGGFIATLDLIPFVATLAAIYLINGVTLVVTQGATIAPVPPKIIIDLLTQVGPLPVIVIIIAAVYILGQCALSFTVWGRHVALVGANPRTALISGVAVRRIAWSTYLIAGGLAGLAGVLFAGRLGGATASTGTAELFTAIGAVVIGGNSLFGGRGSLIRTAIGVLFLGFLANGLQILGLTSSEQRIATGFVIIAAVALDTLVLSRSRRSET
jgi:ribose transport system permease protein